MLKYLVVLGPILNVVTVLTEITEEQLLFTQTPLDLTQRISTVLPFNKSTVREQFDFV